ncbi:MAG: hypothetical protein AB7S49_02860 [Arcobacter sp.]|jgi:hypothetical protein|uniref:Uncharacterized protein n=1 Tax=Arcobacter defluvii TaxID=873191 RepID=A0AAE7BEB3_9BACT|nr:MULTISPECIES: hypothetical protein [Arcobacter]MDY3201473.1 hypothetical protein [Arcobacter sp.]QKF76244.1 hypothetical protein ADFLV_0177 [Arcobacter defluvii]RXI30926.1 hypothetical protein CP964_10735 [Arcobacter defluvii]
MVRLVITDFATKEDSEFFYINDEFDISQNMFTYQSFKKYSVYLSKYTNDEIYSLNLLSRKYLGKNQFLIHIADGEYVILFNHKTVYSAKINQNFITDDMIKSILITKHIAMLSSGGAIENIYYVINSKYKCAIENILKQNTKNEKQEVVAKSLGEMEELVKPLKELDTTKSHITKLVYMSLLLGASFWIIFFGLKTITDKVFYIEPLENLNRELKIETQLAKRQQILLNDNQKKYKDLTDCISKNEVVK